LQLLLPVCRSGDELLRKKVAAEAERLLEHSELDDEYVELVCKVLAAADPKRALDVLPNHLKRCEDPGELKRIVKAIRKRGSAEDLLAPSWQILAEEAAGEQIGELDAADFDEDEDEDDYDDVEEDEVVGRIEAIVAAFADSPQCGELPGGRRKEVATNLEHAFRTMWDYQRKLPDEAGPDDIEELMLQTLPRKAVDSEDGFRVLGAELKAFYRFMTDKGFLKNGEEFVITVERCIEPMVKNAADPAHWGPAKGIFTQMHRDGVNPTDKKAVERWMREFNARPFQERARLIPGPEDFLRRPGFAPLLPDFDDAPEFADGLEPGPEPDPYSPCPCGSGKKYKWCCRDKDRKGRRGGG
jgi:hypothetical protein